MLLKNVYQNYYINYMHFSLSTEFQKEVQSVEKIILSVILDA